MKDLEKILSFFKEDISMNILGIDKASDYYWMLKKIQDKAKEQNIHIYDREFKFPSNLQVITAIQRGLPSMNLNNLAAEEVVLTNNVLLNRKIKNALTKHLQPELLKIQNKNTKENFFVKHIVWLYERLETYNFKTNAKLVFFGKIARDEWIHINILNEIGYFVLFLSPNSTQNDFLPVSTNAIIYEKTIPEISFYEMVALAQEPIHNVVETYAKKTTNEISEMLYDHKSVFKPWQYRTGSTKKLHMDAIMEDIWTYWEQDARFREGFKVENNVVSIPTFAAEIHGIYFDEAKMYDLIQLVTKSELTVLKTSINLLMPTYTDGEMYSLAFAIERTGISFGKLRNHALYKLNSCNMDVQQFIYKKLNEFFIENKQKVKDIDLLKLIANIITMPAEWLSLIENFDFPFRIPKVVLYIKDREQLDFDNELFLKFLNFIGFDILIFSPAGTEVCHNFKDIMLDELKSNYPIENIKKPQENKRKSLFDRWFKD